MKIRNFSLADVLRLLSARRTGVTAMLVMIALFSVSLVVPQWPDFSEREFNIFLGESEALRFAHRWGLTDIYGSPAMAMAFVLLFSNLAVGFGERLRVLLFEIDVRKTKMSGKVPETRNIVSVPRKAEELHRFAALLAAKHFAVVVLPDENGVAAVRNRFSILGSHLFHLSAVFFIAALGLRMATHFHGVTVLGEGETFSGLPAQYLSTRPVRAPDSRFPVGVGFQLQGIHANYHESGRLVDVRAAINPANGEAATEVYANHPFRIQDVSVRLTDYGSAPVFVVREPEKHIEHRAAVRLMLFPAGREDSFRFPELATQFQIAFYPGEKSIGGPASPTVQPARESTAIVKFESNGEAHSALLRQNRFTRVGGLEMGFFDVKYWARFEIDRDGGRLPMYLALVIGFVGLAWRLLLPRSRVDAVWTDEGLRISGRADYTQEPFSSELTQIVAEFTANRAADPG